ncbi:MAG: hypothetical protein EA380_09395 [Phycisphaeraceae bacterium]|nr:MAG: hypothetical protein EA380_09395 [Phycisphaeraceae bacterium]
MPKDTPRTAADTPDHAPRRRPGPVALSLLVLSIICMVAGIALPLILTSADPLPTTIQSPTTTTGPASPYATGLLPTDPSSTPRDSQPIPEEPDSSVLSPAIFQMGFGFFIGFAIAFALRTFIKISLVAMGLFALALFGLEYIGLLSVQWGAIADRYDSFSAWLSAQTESFSAFITGQIPSAATAIAGFAVGFSRKA